MTSEGPKRGVPTPDELLLEQRLARIDDVLSRRTRTLVVVLDRLEDEFNMAAVLRTCEAMGLQEVHVIDNPEHPFRPNGKVTQGCDKWLDIKTYGSFTEVRESLKQRGFQLWVSAIQEGAKSLFELEFGDKVALVFGNERFGVSEETLALADGVFWIPMRGFTQSLNISAAVSASVTQAISWRLRQRGPEGDLSPEEVQPLRERFRFLSVKQRKRIYPAETAALKRRR